MTEIDQNLIDTMETRNPVRLLLEYAIIERESGDNELTRLLLKCQKEGILQSAAEHTVKEMVRQLREKMEG